MNRLLVEQYFFFNKTLYFKVKNNELKNSTNVSIKKYMLIDRKTESFLDGKLSVKKYGEYTIFSINFFGMKFDALEKTSRINIFLVDDTDNLFRPGIDRVELEDKKRKYNTTILKLSDNRSAIIYITKYNNFSIEYGNNQQLFKSFFQKNSTSINYSSYEIEGTVIRIAFDENVLLSEDFLIVITGRKNISYLLETKKHSENGKVYVEFDIENLKVDSDVYHLSILFKLEEQIVQARIGREEINELPNSKTVSYNLKHQQIVLLNIDNRLIVSVSSIINALNKACDSIPESFFVENVIVQQKELILEKANFTESELLMTDHFIVLENTITKETFISFDIKWKSNSLIILVQELFLSHLTENHEPLEVSYYEKQYDKLIKYSIVKNDQKNPEYGEKLGKLALSGDLEVIPMWNVRNEFIFFPIKNKRDVQIDEETKKSEREVLITDLVVEGGFISFQINESHIKNQPIVSFLKNRKTLEKIDVPLTKKPNGLFEIDLFPFIYEKNKEQGRWDLYLSIDYGYIVEEGKIKECLNYPTSNFSRYFYAIKINELLNDQLYEDIDEMEEETTQSNSIVPYLTKNNTVAIVIDTVNKLSKERVKHTVKIVKYKKNNSLITITAIVSLAEELDYTVNTVILKLRNKVTNLEYIIPVKVRKKAQTSIIKFEIDMENFDFIPFYWDLFLDITIQNEEFYLRIKNPTKKIKKNIDKKITRNEISLEDNFMIYPYITLDKSLSFTYRERASYEKLSFRIKEKAAYYFYRVFKKHYDKKDIWLGYEKNANGAQDNGYYFFDYCYKNKKHENFYYIIKEDSADIGVLKDKEDKLLHFMSFKYMVYMFAAKLLVASESKVHSFDIRIQKGLLRSSLRKKNLVFLQHGVIALKRVDYGFKKTKNNAVSLFEVCSEYEKDIIKNIFGYSEQEIMLTGLARWDVLEDKATKENRKIFMMPTWRSWMDGILKEDFFKSDYYNRYKDILESEKLDTLLKVNGVELHFVLHPKFLEYTNEFISNSDNVFIHQFGDIKVNEYLMESSLLITDYSSIAWDMYYQGKPVIFYQFDIEDYNLYEGSYMNFEEEIFGDITYELEELITQIHYYIKNDFKEKNIYENMRSLYFKYEDKNNSKRIYEAIMKNKTRLYKKSNEDSIRNKIKNNRIIRRLFLG